MLTPFCLHSRMRTHHSALSSVYCLELFFCKMFFPTVLFFCKMYLLLNLVICLHSTRKRSREKRGMGISLTLVAVLRSGPAIPIYLFELNPFPNKPWFLRIRSTSIFKTLRENEKLLVMSNFSISNSVFYPLEDFSAVFIKFKKLLSANPLSLEESKMRRLGKG